MEEEVGKGDTLLEPELQMTHRGSSKLGTARPRSKNHRKLSGM